MSRRLFGGASTLLLVCAMVGLSPDTAYAQACPSGYTVTTSGTITGQFQSSLPWILAMAPCQTVSVQIVTASGTTHPWGSANIYFTLRNAAHDTLAETSFVCGISCSGTLPGTNDVAGYPAPGMRGDEGNPFDVVVSTGLFNWFGGPTVSYTLTITVAPRAGYNRGGTSFANALHIDTGVEQKGSIHPREPGQFYRVHLDVGQLLFLRGELTAHYVWGSYFSITLYDENQQELKVMVNEAGTNTFPAAGTAGWVYRNDGAARDFYLKVRAMFYPTWDFKFTAVTPRLTVSSETPTRGDTVTFTVVDAPGGTLSNWRYDITDPLAEATVTRAPSSGADTWPGQLVVTGTAKVTVGLGGFTAQLTKSVAVSPRSWSGFPPPGPQKLEMGDPYSTPCGSGVMQFAPPGVAAGGPPAHGIAASVSCVWASAADLAGHQDHAEVSDGPNTGVKWLLEVHDESSVNWGMHPEAEERDPPTDFWAANCGNFIDGPGNSCATPNGTGFIRAQDFRDGLERHEIGPSNSHYANFKIEISKPDQSLRPNLEGMVAPPLTTMGNFRNNVKTRVLQLYSQIRNALLLYPQPCGPMCDGSCSNYLGHPNLLVNGVYPACLVPAPGPFSFQLFPPKGRVR